MILIAVVALGSVGVFLTQDEGLMHMMSWILSAMAVFAVMWSVKDNKFFNRIVKKFMVFEPEKDSEIN